MRGRIILSDVFEVNEDAVFRIVRECAAQWKLYHYNTKVENTIGGIYQIYHNTDTIGNVEIRPLNSFRSRVVFCSWSDQGGIFDPPNASKTELMMIMARSFLEEVIDKEAAEKWYLGARSELLEDGEKLRDPQPWLHIPDHNWDRQMLEMWHKGSSNSEIARVVNVTARAITNRITQLRAVYGNEIVPYKKEILRKAFSDHVDDS